MSTPDDSPITFDLQTTDGRARRGRLTVPHGSFETPAFMPVGTRATVKGLMPRDLRETGSEICLANTYHLNISPGPQIVKKMGGLHHFMGWDAPILTDSGGYQVFSLPKASLDEEGVTFKFEAKGGRKVTLTPEKSMQIQEDLGADIIMAFDVCVPHPCEYQDAREAVYRTIRWLERCKEAHSREDQALFGIIQGGTYPDLRALSTQLTREIDLPGYAIGGLSVGEGHDLMMRMIDQTEPGMIEDKPRYLMGVGYPEDIIEAVARGIDMFDCVIPSRYARSGVAFTRRGRFRVSNARYKSDKFPLDTNCNCYTCRNFGRAYLNHLINTSEILGSALMTLHNVTFYQDMMRAIRMSIVEGTFQKFRHAFLDEYLADDKKKELGYEDIDGRYDQDDFGWDVEHSVVPPTDIAENLENTEPVDEMAGPGRRIEQIKERGEE
jgi:queuine tRNA-ribosyltransferase